MGRRPRHLRALRSSPAADATPPAAATDRFRAVYDAHFREIETYCARRLGHDAAHDAVNETFLVAWRRLDDVPQDDQARLWLYGVARHVVANAVRSKTRQKRLHLRLAAEPAAAGIEAVEERDSSLYHALRALRPEEAEILLLHAWEGFGPKDLATILACTPNAASIRLHRARTRLAEELAHLAESERNLTESEKLSESMKDSVPAGHERHERPSSGSPSPLPASARPQESVLSDNLSAVITSQEGGTL